jgi:hypothetical protein
MHFLMLILLSAQWIHVQYEYKDGCLICHASKWVKRERGKTSFNADVSYS